MTVCEACGHSARWEDTSIPRDSVNFASADPSSSATRLRTACADIETELARFEAFSARYVSSLVDQQEEYNAHLDAVVYPVLSLPTEITCQIFVECLREDGYVRPSITRAPLLLMRVCRTWRNIALSTPELWCSLELESPGGSQILFPQEPLATWFSRAHAHRLSLTFRRKIDVWNVFQVADRVMQLDLPAIQSRLMHLEMIDFRSLQLFCLKSPLPALRCLSASMLETEIEHVLKNAPSLTELHWAHVGQLSKLRRFSSTTIHILDIRSVCLSASKFITILRNFPSLSDLTCVVDPGRIRDPAPLTFSNLLSLHLRYSLASQAPSIRVLELLTLPHLRRLGCSSYLHPGVLLPFLSRSQCVIREVECDLPHGAPLWQQLEMVQSVETLYATIHYRVVDFLRTIGDENHHHRHLRLPQLRHLTIDYNPSPSYPELDFRVIKEILEVARQRRGGAAGTVRLESLHLVFKDSTDWDRWSTMLLSDLRHLVLSGLDFKVRVRSGRVIWPERPDQM